MPINSVTVNNFQSIQKAKVDFPSKESGGSVTTIVGPSSTGKSALLRALKTLIRNTSSAPVRIQDGATKTTVSADFDGVPVRVERGKSLSTYYVGTEKYSKAGTSVPQAVQDILRFDNSSPELHIAFQFDKPYLLDESGSTVSALIGKLTHANTLRLAVKEGNRRSLEANRLLKTRMSDLEKTKDQLAEFSWVDKSVSDVQESGDLLKDIKSKVGHRDTITTALNSVVENTQKHAQASQNVLKYPDVSQEVSESETLLERCTKVYSVISLIEDKKYFATKLLESKPKSLSDSDVDVVDCLYAKLLKVNATLDMVRVYGAKFQKLTEETLRLKEDSDNVAEVYTRTLRSAGRCPTCFQYVSPEEGGLLH